MGTPPSNQTNAQRLQNLKDENEQLRMQIERLAAVEAENVRLVERVAALESDANPTNRDQLVASVRNLRERLGVAETDKALMERRVIAAGHDIIELNARLGRVRDLIRGKDCLLPQIAEIVG